MIRRAAYFALTTGITAGVWGLLIAASIRARLYPKDTPCP